MVPAAACREGPPGGGGADPRESRRGEAGAGHSAVHPPPMLSPFFSFLSVPFSLPKHLVSRSPFSPDSHLLSSCFRLSTPLIPQVPSSLSSNLDRPVVGCAPEVLVPSQTTPKLHNGGTPRQPGGARPSREGDQQALVLGALFSAPAISILPAAHFSPSEHTVLCQPIHPFLLHPPAPPWLVSVSL